MRGTFICDLDVCVSNIQTHVLIDVEHEECVNVFPLVFYCSLSMFEEHNIIHIHNNVMHDRQYFTKYSIVHTEYGNILQNIVSPT